MLYNYIEQILDTPIKPLTPYFSGKTKAGRPLPAYRFGRGDFKISLIAGCHADEPSGPRLLKKLVNFLDQLDSRQELLKEFSWQVVPHANPDGEAVNQNWYSEEDAAYNLAAYLKFRDRALPGDDIEFGFPIEGQATALRPENAFIYDFWRTCQPPFHLHASLHSMGIAFGAWFLIDQNWIPRSEIIQKNCLKKTKELAYPLHDIDRKGEKGFHRIAEGFCTRPDSNSMRKHFLELGDEEMASKFHPSSMESIRSLGGDCLTLVSEMPLFLIPRKTRDISWPNAEFDAWRNNLGNWQRQLFQETISESEVKQEAEQSGLRPMPVADQMRLQWGFACAGIEQAWKENFSDKES